MPSAALVRCLRRGAPSRHATALTRATPATSQHRQHTSQHAAAQHAAPEPAPRSAYVHLPFCKRKCHYCDFPVHAVGKNPGAAHVQRQMQQYVDAVCAEIGASSGAARPSAALDTVFFGGGTPSLVPPELVHQILLTLRSHYGINPDAEISLEADPGTFDQARLEAYVALGVTRISLGVQSFHQELLDACGRSHNLPEVHAALDAVRKCGVRSWSLDLISGLPNLDMKRWTETLRSAVDAAPNHISVYDLQVEEGTPFARWYDQGRLSFPRDDDAADMYGQAVQILTSAGYEHYEVSNYAKPGHRSRHNQAYWKGVPYLAFGVGAASYLGGQRFTRPATLSSYLSWVEQVSQQQQQQQHQQQQQQQQQQGRQHGQGQQQGLPSGAEGRAGPLAGLAAGADAGARSEMEAEAAAGPGPGSLTAAGGKLEPPSQEDLMLDTIMLRLRTADGLDMHAFAELFGEEQAAVVCKALERHERRGLVLRLPRLSEGVGEGAAAGNASDSMQAGASRPSGEADAGQGKGVGASNSSGVSCSGAPKVEVVTGMGHHREGQGLSGRRATLGRSVDEGEEELKGRRGGVWDFRVRLSDPEGFLLSNDIISDAFAAFSFN